VAAFSEIFARAALEADDEAEEKIVVSFVEEQRSIISNLIEMDKQGMDSASVESSGSTGGDGDYRGGGDSEEDNESPMGVYVTDTLNFVHRHLGDREEAAKYLQHLTRLLLRLVEEELFEAFDRARRLHVKRGSAPEAFHGVARALPMITGLRSLYSVSSDDSDLLATIRDSLYPASGASALLFSRHLAQIKRSAIATYDHGGQPVAEIRFRACLQDTHDRVYVQLLEATKVRPRDSSSKDAPSFSLTVSVLPLWGEPHLVRRGTLCHHRCTSIRFGEDNGSADGEPKVKRFDFLMINTYNVQYRLFSMLMQELFLALNISMSSSLELFAICNSYSPSATSVT